MQLIFDLDGTISDPTVGIGRSINHALAADHGAVVIGDRAVDIAAARANGLRSIAVLWGHGSREELLGAVPDRLLESPMELKRLAGELFPNGTAEPALAADGRR